MKEFECRGLREHRTSAETECRLDRTIRKWRRYLDVRRKKEERVEMVQVTVLAVVTLGIWAEVVLMLAGYGL